MLIVDSKTDLAFRTRRSLTAHRKPRCLKLGVTSCGLKVFNPTYLSFSGNNENVVVRWSRSLMSQSSCETESKLSRPVSRLRGGRRSTDVRTKRYSNDCRNFSLSLIIGQLKVTRGVKAAIPTKEPPRRRTLGKKLCALTLNFSEPAFVCTAVTPPVNCPYSGAYGLVNT